MRTLFCAVFASGCLFAGEAAADWTVACHHDLPGAAEKQLDKVVVPGANSLAQACEALRNDPLYGDYNWRTCVDATDQQGTCANPATPGPGTGTPGSPGPSTPGPGPGPGMPPSPPIGPVSTEPNINRQGFDYATIPLAQPDVRLCSTMCERDPRCAAYTYVNPGYQAAYAVCWLKSQVPAPVSDPCCISGMR
jgi:hypothetical protein